MHYHFYYIDFYYLPFHLLQIVNKNKKYAVLKAQENKNRNIC